MCWAGAVRWAQTRKPHLQLGVSFWQVHLCKRHAEIFSASPEECGGEKGYLNFMKFANLAITNLQKLKGLMGKGLCNLAKKEGEYCFQIHKYLILSLGIKLASEQMDYSMDREVSKCQMLERIYLSREL